jgi:hypothetical protein
LTSSRRLGDRLAQRPRHKVGLRPFARLVIDGLLATKRGIAFAILAHLGGSVMDFVGGTTDVFSSLPDIVIDPRNLGFAHAVGRHGTGRQAIAAG